MLSSRNVCAFVYFYQNAIFLLRLPDSVYTKALRKAGRGLIVAAEETLQEGLAFCVVPWMGFSHVLRHGSQAALAEAA